MSMWAWFNSAPWWARWFVISAAAALMEATVFAVTLPTPGGTLAWAWGLGLLAGSGVIIGALMTAIHEPLRQFYAAALDGMSKQQRAQAVRALHRGPIPTDPTVLAAAVRNGNRASAYGKRITSSRWVSPALFIVLAAWEFLTGQEHRSVVWVGFALISATLAVWSRHRGARAGARLDLLRSAASADSRVATAVTQDSESIALPARRWWLWGALVVVVVVTVVVATLASTRSPRADCRAARDAIEFIADRPKTLNPWLITPSGLSTTTYTDWSDQLQRFSSQVADADVVPHFHRIADLSKQAVSQVKEARSGPLPPAPDQFAKRVSAYQNTIQQIFEEERALIAVCWL